GAHVARRRQPERAAGAADDDVGRGPGVVGDAARGQGDGLAGGPRQGAVEDDRRALDRQVVAGAAQVDGAAATDADRPGAGCVAEPTITAAGAAVASSWRRLVPLPMPPVVSRVTVRRVAISAKPSVTLATTMPPPPAVSDTVPPLPLRAAPGVPAASSSSTI